MTKTLSVVMVVFASASASAQVAALKQPQQSPAAKVEQTVGLTEIQISYHRPAVNGRKVWGQLVPYGEVWRAGANENTTISFSSAVKVAGKPLAAGTYGLHMIPTAKEWTVIFSNQSGAWGSFTYDKKEDALRVTVTPRALDAPVEHLLYEFESPTENSVTAALRWEKLEVPIAITVDTPAVVMASMRGELRGLPNFFWQGWNQAARYWVEHGGNLDEATKMADKSIQVQQTFTNLMTRAKIADKKHDGKMAADLRGKALALANENELNQYGYVLMLQEKKVDEAIAIFQKNVQMHPESWNVHDSLGEAYLTKGERKLAEEHYAKALSMVKDAKQKERIQRILTQIRAGS